MKEYIEREAFIEAKRKQYCADCDRRKGVKNGKMRFCYEIGEAPCRACYVDDLLTDVEDAPAADVVKVRHGKWVAGRKIGREFVGSRTESVLYDEWGCNCCGLAIRTPYKPIYKYCPNCGAKMTEDYHEQKE